MTDRNGKTTTYVYDEINRVTEIHRPNGVSTYNTYNARDQIVSLQNTCDECGWVVSRYDYTYDENGYIATEKAVESLYDYAWDDKHNGKHEDGRHDDKMPHGTKHNGKHDKDSEYHFQLVETDREFTYDKNGRLLSSREQEENSGLTAYDYTYDKAGNRLSYVKKTQTTKHPDKTDVAESAFYQYNDSNQLVSARLFDGKKNTTVTYTYDENGNLISEIGEYGTDKVETYYDYTVENRLQAVYDADELLMAAAYDGDGNRVFQLNYNLHTDEDWKDNSGSGNGNNKDNAGSGNGKGNATNAEEHNSQNQSGILFPIAAEISRTETDLTAMIKTTGKEKNYELIEYILDVNTQYTQVLMELNENGAMDAAYTYGVSRLTEDRFTGESNFYLYDPAGNVAGITDQDGYLWQSYRYDAFGNATFGSPQYDNEYTFNGESYNPNIHSQYLRARYYDTVKGSFLTEDSYLGDIRNPLTLNRYSYCIGNPLFYVDPSGHWPTKEELKEIENYTKRQFHEEWEKEYLKRAKFLESLEVVYGTHFNTDYVTSYDYEESMNENYVEYVIGKAAYLTGSYYCENFNSGKETKDGWLDLYYAPTVNQRGRFVQIPLDRPRKRGELIANVAPSWKAEEPMYVEKDKEGNIIRITYINKYAYDKIMKENVIPEPKPDAKGVIRSVVDNVDRYWIGVGPRVMIPGYSTIGNGEDSRIEIPTEKMGYGTRLDVILRDDKYNIYFVPALVGDTKEHTLGNNYLKYGTAGNGVFQTGISWATGTDQASGDADAAVIEFIRDYNTPGVPKNLMHTPDYDILGIIVYD